MKNYLFILLALSASADAGSIYRCGQNYSDQPCGAEASVVARTPDPASPESVRPGMTEEAMVANMDPGRPIVKVNVTETAGGVEKQFVVGRHVGSQSYIYTRNGVVTAVQW